MSSILEPDASDNRREYPRYRMKFRVELNGVSNFYLGLTENISEGGFFVVTDHVLPIGSLVELQLWLLDASDPISVMGEVRWARTPEATTDPCSNFQQIGEQGILPGLGIQFRTIDPRTLAQIRDFVRMRPPDFFEP